MQQTNVPTMTQAEVDHAFAETKKLWGSLKEASGKPYFLFILSRDAIEFLAKFEEIRQVVLSMGLNVPTLVEGVTIREVNTTQCSECAETIDEDEDDMFDGMCNQCYSDL